MNEQDIFNRIRLITDKLTQKQQLQSLAKSNGIEINELELTEDAADAVVISVIALMLAKMNQDERYRKLCDFGMQKRSLKVEIINDYKQRANMLYNQFKTGNMTPVNDIVDDVSYDESYVDDDIDNDDTIIENFFNSFKPRPGPKPNASSNYNTDDGNNNEKQNWKRVAMDIADKWVQQNIPRDLMKFLKEDNMNLDNMSFEVNKNIYTFKKNESSKYNFDDWFYDELVKGFLLYYSKDIDNTDQLETLFETHKDDIPVLPILDDIIDDNDEAWRITYNFQLKEYTMFSTSASKEVLKLGKSWTKFIEKFKK